MELASSSSSRKNSVLVLGKMATCGLILKEMLKDRAVDARVRMRRFENTLRLSRCVYLYAAYLKNHVM